MAICNKIYWQIPLMEYFKHQRSVIFNNRFVYGKLNYSQNTTTYPKGINKNRIIHSPYSNVPIDSTNNLRTFLWRRQKCMNNTALVCGVSGESITYGELKILSEKIGYALLKRGFKPGEVISVVLPNFLETPVILLGAVAAGLSICSINPAYTPDEIKYQIENSQSVGVVTFENNLPNIIEAISKIERPVKVILTPGLKDDEVKDQMWTGSNKSDIIFYESLIKENINEIEGSLPNSKAGDLFHISHSSGTTGLPKGIWLSHSNFINNILQLTSVSSLALQKFATENYQDVVPMVLPMFHNLALAMVLKSIYVGSKIITIPKFNANTFLNIIEKYQASVLYMVPPLVQYLIEAKNVTNNHKQNLKQIVCAGAPLAIPDFGNIMASSFPGVHFRQGYGLTEGTCFVTISPVEFKKCQTVGIPLPNVQVKVVDLIDGTNKETNSEGEICFKGPQMTKGYINNPKANEDAIDKDGWFHTGDIGYYDKNGYFFIVDRLKDMIKVKGFQVSPTELEELLKTHESVIDAAVLGIQHPKKGETPIAFIISDNNSDKTKLEQQLISYIQERVASYKEIEKIFFVDEIPKTPSGKILKRELKFHLKNVQLH